MSRMRSRRGSCYVLRFALRVMRSPRWTEYTRELFSDAAGLCSCPELQTAIGESVTVAIPSVGECISRCTSLSLFDPTRCASRFVSLTVPDLW